jgi:hypothetical protein
MTPAELNEAVPEPHQGEAAEYSRSDVIPTTEEVVPESVVLLEPDLGHHQDPEAHHHDDAVPVVTEHERQEVPQQESEPILIPVPVPVSNYDMPSFPVNLGSEREVWGGEHDHGAYPTSSVPVVNEDVETSPAPSIRCVELFFFCRELCLLTVFFRVPFTDPFADPIAPRITVSQPVLDMPQYVYILYIHYILLIFLSHI